MFVGFNVRVECESLVKNNVDSEVRDLLVIDSQGDNCEKSREKHMLEIEYTFVKLYFVIHFATWPTRE